MIVMVDEVVPMFSVEDEMYVEDDKMVAMSTAREDDGARVVKKS